MSGEVIRIRTNYEMGDASAKAYREIRSRIIDGTFKLGQVLPERVLCEASGVSRTPVREALRRLDSEGMVNLSTNRKAYVPIIDHQEIEDVFSLATLLGNYSARIAARNISESGLDELLALADQKDALLLRGDDDLPKAFIRADRLVHIIILEAVGNHRLSLTCSALMRGPILHWAVARFTPHHFKMSARFHRELFEALKARDPDKAETAMNDFIAVVWDAALLIVNKSH